MFSTMTNNNKFIFNNLEQILEGDLKYDTSTLLQYATDASAYREVPLAVALP